MIFWIKIPLVSWYHKVSIQYFIGANDDGGGSDKWSCKTCKAPVKSSLPANQQPTFLQAGCPSCTPTNSVKALKQKVFTFLELLNPSLPGCLPTLSLATKGFWLPWERVAKRVVSRLTPVPQRADVKDSETPSCSEVAADEERITSSEWHLVDDSKWHPVVIIWLQNYHWGHHSRKKIIGLLEPDPVSLAIKSGRLRWSELDVRLMPIV